LLLDIHIFFGETVTELFCRIAFPTVSFLYLEF